MTIMQPCASASSIGEQLTCSPKSGTSPGVYMLLDPIQPDGGGGTYVGKAPAGLRSLLLSHLKNKDHWSRAILVCRDTTHALNYAQIGWLERRLYDFLKAAGATAMHNGNRPSDATLPPYERSVLEACAIPVSRTLFQSFARGSWSRRQDCRMGSGGATPSTTSRSGVSSPGASCRLPVNSFTATVVGQSDFHQAIRRPVEVARCKDGSPDP
jgi:hypothetical protein